MLPHEIAFFVPVCVCVCFIMMLLLVQAYKLVTINNLTKNNTIIAESSGEEAFENLCTRRKEPTVVALVMVYICSLT